MDKCILVSLAVLAQLWYMGYSKMLKECYKTYSISTLIYHKNMEKTEFKTNSKAFMMSNWESCFMSCCRLPYCSQVVHNQHVCMHVHCDGTSNQGFCKYRPGNLKDNDLHGVIIKYPRTGGSLGKQLDSLQFRNGPSLVTSDMRFTFTQQCAQYVEKENVTGVATSWATKRFSPFSYLYQDNGKEPALGMRSAVPLGGLGTGSFELRADGSFNEWTLENQSPGGSAKLSRGALDLAFLAIRVQTLQGIKASLLRTHPPHGLPGVSGLAYSGSFPVSKLGIEDEGFSGLKMEVYAYSSIKARSAVDSALPAVVLSLRIRNPTSNRAEVSLLLNLPLGEQPDTARKGGNFKVIQDISSAAACAQLCRNNNKCMAWSLVKTSCKLKHKMPLHAYKEGVTSGVKNHWVRNYGRLTCTRPGSYSNSGNTTIMWVANDYDHHDGYGSGYYDERQQNKLRSNMKQYSNNNSIDNKGYYYNNYNRYYNKQRRSSNDNQRHKPNSHKIAFSSTVSDDIDLIWKYFAKYGHLRNMAFKESGFHGSAAGKMSLGPGEEGTISLVMSWFYPYRDHAGEYVGQYYRNIFKSSEDVAFHTKQNLPKILDELQMWRDNMTPSNKDSGEVKPSLPDWLQDMLVNSLSSWRIGFWVADGRWRQWETFDCNDVDSVHNDFQRELPYILFFPGLLENVVRAWASSQHESGLILEALQGQYGCWSKTNKLDTVGGRYNMADVNPAFITQVYHLYRWAGKDKLLQELWSAVRKAIIWMIKGATEGTGLPFRMTNTYDILQLQNYDHSFYNSVMYLLGLRAAEEMAEIYEDEDLLFLVRDSILKAGRKIDALFWDDERGYYHAWWDRAKGSPPWLMADSLYGQVWAYTLGLGDLLPVAKMRLHLEKEGILNDTPYGLQVVTKNIAKISQKIFKRDLDDFETEDNIVHEEGLQYPYMWTTMNGGGYWKSFNEEPGSEPNQIIERPQPNYFYSSTVEQYRPTSKVETALNGKLEYSPNIFAFYTNIRPSNYAGVQDVDRLAANDVTAANNYLYTNDYHSSNNDDNNNDKYISNHRNNKKIINSDNKKTAYGKIPRNTNCSLLHKDLMFGSIWMGASPDWTTLQIHLGLDPSKALEQARKSLNHYRTKLNDLWNIHGLTAGSGHGLDGQPWCTSHYTFHMVLWHIPLALSGQQYSIIERALQFNPKLRVPYSLPFFVPYASGTIEAVHGRARVSFTLTVTHGYLVLKQLSISGVDWPGTALKLEKGESTTWS